MNFDDDEVGEEVAPKPRFAPKSRFAPRGKKPLAEAKEEKEVKPINEVVVGPPPPPVVVVKEEVVVEKMEVEEVEMKEEEGRVVGIEMSSVSAGGSDWMKEDGEEAEVGVEEEEDQVVAEYDVYFTPRDPDTQLYVMQYPLRPSWRPYELEQRCTEVRVRPRTTEVEVDLSVEVDSENYDPRSPAAERMNKQTLSSSWMPPQASGYAVGLLTGKKLYLNPIHAVVQLRPSMEYLDSDGLKKKINSNTAVREEATSSEVLAGSSRKQNKQMDPEVVEPWIPLKYHSSTTDLAERYRRQMVTDHDNPLQFLMNPYDYLNSLCPGGVTSKMQSKGPSRRSLLSLPLEERLKMWLVEGPPVQRFTAIKHLAPDDTVEDVLLIIQQYAYLVQGLWVAQTKIRHPNAQKAGEIARDYALAKFSQSPVIRDSEFDILGSHKSVGKTFIREIAVERPYCKDWKFKEPTDVTFMKLYPDVVEHQKKRMKDLENKVSDTFSKRKGVPSTKKPGPFMHSDEGVARATNVAHFNNMSMSRENREAPLNFLRKRFQIHKVLNFQTIYQILRDTAVQMSSVRKEDARVQGSVAAFKSVLDAPREELQAIISEVAIYVNGVYVLKTSTEHPELNPLRNVIIDLFLGSGPNAKLKKGEIIEAAKIKLQKEPTSSEFQKVINEFCVSKGGAWILQSGDVVPK